MKDEKTTITDRASTAAVNGVLAGSVMSASLLAINGVSKLFSKTSQLRFSPLQWKLAGAATAVGAAVGFFTANKSQEDRREAYLNAALEKANAPNNHYSEAERSQLINQAASDVLSGKVDAPPQESTKFRDHVSASRAASSNTSRSF